MASLLLGIDVGTYSTKGVIVDLAGNVVRTATAPHSVDFPRPGWAEQHPDDVWWAGVCAVARQLLADDHIEEREIAAIGLSAIGPCMVPLDRDGVPVRPGILYGVDTRAHQEIAELEEKIGYDEIVAWSRMELSSQAVGPKISWFRRQEPELYDRTAHIVTASSYLVRRLTGRLTMDHHQAAHFMPLYDQETQDWSDRYADGICSPEMLPELGWCDEVAGKTSARAERETGIPEGIPVIVGGVDALAEAVSVGAIAEGDVMIMYGSTAFFILTTNGPITSPPLWSLPGAFSGSHVTAAGMATTGSLTRWLADLVTAAPHNQVIEIEKVYELLFDEARAIPPGSDGIIVLPYFSGERTPINDPNARGVVAGLSLAHSRGHLFRAALEGVAYGIRHNLETMDSHSSQITRCIAVGGGTHGDLWVQIVSDATQRSQLVPTQTIGASYGDAYLAGLGANILTSEDLSRWIHFDRTIKPDRATAPLHEGRYSVFRELYTATRPIVHELSVPG